MTENVRRRASKWDMIAEPSFFGESKQGDAFVKETEMQSDPSYVNPDNDQFSLGPEMKSGITFKTDISQEDENFRISEGLLHANGPPKLAIMGKDIAKSSPWDSDSGNRTTKDAETGKRIDGEDSTLSQERNLRKSPGLDAWKRHSHNVSPRGGRTRSESRSRSGSRSQSKSWSRSRSRSYSPFDGRPASDRWSSRGRNRTGGQAPPCRDFAVGRCRRGSQCRFLHEDGGRGDYVRYSTHSRDAKLERGSSSWHNGKENFTGSWDQTEHSRNKPFPRQRSHYDAGEREKPELHRNSKSSEFCFDFTKGKCHRGSACRYIHHETASRGGWKDETREENYDRRDSDASFSQRTEPRRVSDTPCKFFPEGRCRRGQSCKFSHQETDNMEGKPHGSNWGFDQIIGMGSITPSHWITGHDGVGSTASQSIQMGDPTQKHQNDQSHKIENTDSQVQDVHKDIDPQAQKKINEVVDHAAAKPEVNPVSSVTEQSFAQTGLGQFAVPQQLHVQNFPPTIQIPHAITSLPFSGQMQQVVYSVPPNGQTQYLVPLTSDAQHRNLNMQSQSVLSLTHSVQNQQNLGEQIQQNAVPSPRNVQNQQNLNLSEHNPQLLSSVNGQSQQNMHLNGQIQQNVSPPNQQISRNVAFVGQSHQSLAPPQNDQIEENLQSIATVKQNTSIEPPSDNSFNSDNFPTNGQKMPEEGSYSVAGAPEMKASTVNSTPAIPHKVVTSEQAARITDLSASLAQFFGNAPLNVSTLGMPLTPHSNTSSIVVPKAAISSPFQPIQGVAKNEQDGAISNSVAPVKPENGNRPGDPRFGNGREISLKGVLPSSNTDCVGKHENSDAMQVELSSSNPPKEVNGIETGQDKNEQQAQENVDEDAVDGENKQTKDSKGLKMFKYALVEFVKDLLKPAWKEGQLSREAHKTIVKKVVDKVTGAVQTANIPQTQEKIDVYLAHYKSKLSKLVQAYVEKYVKDFKASNIRLDENFNPKSSDFGLAKVGPVGNKSHVSTRVMGTYGYCAPEYALTSQHDLAHPPIIYRDFKASNIRLDENFNPKSSDFGLAKVGPVGNKSHVSTRVMGTYGYCAPEYALTSQLTKMTDAYSFGVVFLEIITGRRAIDTSGPSCEQQLIQWAEPRFRDKKRFVEMADPLLEGKYHLKGLYQALAVAAMCLQEETSSRPLISDVVTALKYLVSEPSEGSKQNIPPSLSSQDSQQGQVEGDNNSGEEDKTKLQRSCDEGTCSSWSDKDENVKACDLRSCTH